MSANWYRLCLHNRFWVMVHGINIKSRQSYDKGNQILQIKPEGYEKYLFTAALKLERKWWSYQKTRPWLEQKWAVLEKLALVLNTISKFKYFSMKTT